MVLFLRAKEANVPTLGPRFLVKFPRMGKAIEVKCPTKPGISPLGLNIDTCIIKPWSNGPASSRKWTQVELA